MTGPAGGRADDRARGAAGRPASWVVERHHGRAAELHALVPPVDAGRRVWVLDPTVPAVVLGSTQDETVVDRDAVARLGADVVRRRSGGGAVWVAPGDPVWVDILIPRHDPLWVDDVSASFGSVGRAWQTALAAVGVGGTTVHDGAMVRTAWSSLVCFAGTGAGEVLRDGSKLVGISQRRTRHGARFQSAAIRRWDPEPLAAALVDGPSPDEWRRWGTGMGDDVAPDDLVAALVEALTAAGSG